MTRADILEAARAYVGVPFRWAGRSDEGLDCVGLPLVVARDLGVFGWQKLWADTACHAYPRVRAPGFLRAKFDGFVSEGILRRIDVNDLQPADLVLRFATFGHDHHVSLLSKPGWMIEARSKPERIGLALRHIRGRVLETRLTPQDMRSFMTGYQFAGVD